MTVHIYILLPVHNRREVTRRFINCLKLQTCQEYHLILIDDGSTDETDKMVRDQINNLTVITGDGNWWWAGSLQQGINWLKKHSCLPDDLVLLINDDVLFDPFFLEKAIAIMKKQKRTLILAQLIDKKTGNTVESGVHANLRNQKFRIASSPTEINCLSTRGLFLKFADLLEIGDFHPRLLPHYGSDYEFTIRAQKKGFLLFTTPDLAICPDEKQTGFHKIHTNNPIEYLSIYFSKKYNYNPFARTMLTILTASKWDIPRLIFLVSCNVSLTITKCFWYAILRKKRLD